MLENKQFGSMQAQAHEDQAQPAGSLIIVHNISKESNLLCYFKKICSNKP